MLSQKIKRFNLPRFISSIPGKNKIGHYRLGVVSRVYFTKDHLCLVRVQLIKFVFIFDQVDAVDADCYGA